MFFVLIAAIAVFYANGRFELMSLGRDLESSLLLIQGGHSLEPLFNAQSLLLFQLVGETPSTTLYVTVLLFSSIRLLSTLASMKWYSFLITELAYLISCPYRLEWGSVRAFIAMSVYISILSFYSIVVIRQKQKQITHNLRWLLLFSLPGLYHASFILLGPLSFGIYCHISRIIPRTDHPVFNLVSSQIEKSNKVQTTITNKGDTFQQIFIFVLLSLSTVGFLLRERILYILFLLRANHSRLQALELDSSTLSENIGSPNFIRVAISLLTLASVLSLLFYRRKDYQYRNHIDWIPTTTNYIKMDTFIMLSISSLIASIVLYFLFIFDFSSSNRFLDLSLPFSCIVIGYISGNILIKSKILLRFFPVLVACLLSTLYSAFREFHHSGYLG